MKASAVRRMDGCSFSREQQQQQWQQPSTTVSSAENRFRSSLVANASAAETDDDGDDDRSDEPFATTVRVAALISCRVLPRGDNTAADAASVESTIAGQAGASLRSRLSNSENCRWRVHKSTAAAASEDVVVAVIAVTARSAGCWSFGCCCCCCCCSGRQCPSR